MNVLWGVVIGGAISLAATLTVDWVNSRRQLQRRWDSDVLDAIEHLVDVANRTIGALYDEGRARYAGDPESAVVAERDRNARSHMDTMRVAHARARLMAPKMRPVLDRYREALDQLKLSADRGFDPTGQEWKDHKARLEGLLDDVLNAAAARLQIGDRS